MRSAAHPCPVAGCGNVLLRGHAVCRSCWRRLPADLTGPIVAARAARARHLEAKAAMRATAWLVAHPPAAEAARRCGEGL